MPYYRRRRTRFIRRRYARPFYRKASRRTAYRFRRRGRLYGRRRGITRFPVVPRVAYRKLRYFDVWTLQTDAIQGVVNQIFRGNSIFDPDYTGIGGVASYGTAYEALYGTYEVVGSRITVRFANSAGSGTMLVGIKATSSLAAAPTTGTTAQQALMEIRQDSRRAILQSKDNQTAATTQIAWRKMYMSTRKIMQNQYNSADNTSVFSTNPVLVWYWIITACNLNGTTGGEQLQAAVTITYYCKFATPKYISNVED